MFVSINDVTSGRRLWQASWLRAVYLDTNEWTDQPTKEAVHTEFAGHCHQAKAGLAVADNWLMIQRIVSEIEIARAIPAALMAETASQDARQFSPGMGMLEHTGAGVRHEQKRARL